MAIGIDALAHLSALEVGGKTIAVLGCGVDIVYPAINRNLYHRIITKGGLVISEFPPGRTVLKGLFIARNRIISGISKGIAVIEGSENSGALITARYAAEQGRDVFAPPSPITSPMSTAPNILIKEGARFITSAEDILDEYGINQKIQQQSKILELTQDEKSVFDSLMQEPKFLDDLIVATQFGISEISNLVSILEIKGAIEKNSEGKYQVKTA
jgi:DNA processing protein